MESLPALSILQRLGSGACGEVYAAKLLPEDTVYAVKKKKLQCKCDIEQILIEREILAKADHEGLVQLHLAFADDRNIFFVMTYAPGGSFANVLHRETIEDCVVPHVFSQLFSCVDALHRLGYMHRDIKPENFVVGSDGNLILIDFDCATKNKPVHDGLRVGTSSYMAPEIIHGECYDYTVDYWGLGCILYEIWTGERLFEGSDISETRSQVMNWEAKVTKSMQKFNSDTTLWQIFTSLVTKRSSRLYQSLAIREHAYLNGIRWDELRRYPLFSRQEHIRAFASPTRTLLNDSCENTTAHEEINGEVTQDSYVSCDNSITQKDLDQLRIDFGGSVPSRTKLPESLTGLQERQLKKRLKQRSLRHDAYAWCVESDVLHLIHQDDQNNGRCFVCHDRDFTPHNDEPNLLRQFTPWVPRMWKSPRKHIAVSMRIDSIPSEESLAMKVHRGPDGLELHDVVISPGSVLVAPRCGGDEYFEEDCGEVSGEHYGEIPIRSGTLNEIFWGIFIFYSMRICREKQY